MTAATAGAVGPVGAVGAVGVNVGVPTPMGDDNSVDVVSKEMKKRDCQKWTEMEDNWLVSGVREFGKGHWKQILEKYKGYFQYGRNRFTLRLRYAYLMKTGRIELAPAIVTNDNSVGNIPQVNPVAGVTGEIHEKLMAAAN